MAFEKQNLKVIRSPRAIDDLHEIWQWNARHWTVEHADEYLIYVNDQIDQLAENYQKGRQVSERPDLCYILVRKRSKGHGHILVYQFDHQSIRVLHIFHTAQD
jgi:plasmid stabilization system protein ParE